MQLTEQDILARSNKYNLAEIKKLNMSGCGLTDVSILEKLPNLQILILSQNHIKSLKQLQKCFRLQELYLRSNDIQDFDELIYLKNLPLKRLVLADNPCSRDTGENYRVTAIKMLPFLESFDNQGVTRHELEKALNLRILQRNFEDHHQSSALQPSSDSGCSDNMEFSNAPQGSTKRADSPASTRNSKSPEIFSQPRLCSNRKYGGEHISLPSTRRHHQGYDCDNIFNSHMDFSEWERRNPCQDRLLRYSENNANNILIDRTEQLRSSNGYESRGFNPTSARAERCMTFTQLDEDRNDCGQNSSIASTYRSNIIFPRSRRVNLLCAALRFVLELDVLNLVDLLSIIRAKIQELISAQ